MSSLIYTTITMSQIPPAVVFAKRYGLFENFELMKSQYRHIYDILSMAGFVDDNGVTKDGWDAEQCHELFEYIVLVSKDLMYDEKPEKIWDNYVILRRGLGEYSSLIMNEFLDELKKFMGNEKPKNIFDLCGGSGDYLKTLLQFFPGSKGVLVDKNVKVANDTFKDFNGEVDVIRKNIKSDPRFLDKFKGTQDIVLINEVMHLGGPKFWHELFFMSKEILKPGGILVVGEVIPNPVFQWRMRAFTDEGQSIDPKSLSYTASLWYSDVKVSLHSKGHNYFVFCRDNQIT